MKNNIYLKVTVIVAIALLLLIPTVMIQNLIKERELTQNDAIKEVSSKWGAEQTIYGPIISIPYLKYVKDYSKKDSVGRTIIVKDYIHFLPNQLNIKGEIFPEIRNRSIYEIVVYNSKLDFEGTFTNMDISQFDIPIKNILFDKAEFVVGIDDLRGIKNQVNLLLNNKSFSFNPGPSSKDIVNNGICSVLPRISLDSANYNFKFSLELKGSQLLYFTPVGKVTNVNISSKWNNPSFNGSYLPEKREVSENGFKAKWNILHLNREYPQVWTGDLYKIENSAFGINLLLPVDSYQKSTRTIKYAILFIGFTFLVFFFIEVLNKIFLHPIQYILVGIALIVFYILLLSISEYLSFNLAFILSAILVLLLISGYVKAIIKNNKLTIILIGILFILYTFIFVIIQLQDYALLIGSAGVFIVLSMIMYISRKIDWYNLNLKDKTKLTVDK